MKVCRFCNTENDDSAVKCSSCGSNTFSYKCNNCGTMFTEGVHCPHCGVKIGQPARICPKCKTQYYSNACPTCGYVLYNDNLTPTYINNAYAPVQPKRKTWLWVLGWIFIFPLPLTLILLKKPDMDKKVKYGIIIAAWALYAVLAFVGGNSNSKKPTSDDSKASSPSTSATEAQEEVTLEATEYPTQQSTEAHIQEPSEVPTNKPTEAPTPIVFIDYSASVEAGSTAYVTIQGKPNTEYSISVFYDSTESTAQGLEKKTADDYGYVTWEWKVGSNTNKGEHSITVRGGGARESVKFTVY